MGIFIIIVLYMSINFAYVRVIGLEGLRNTKGIASVMAAHVFGDAAGKILSILLFLSVLAYVNVLLMSNPRVMCAMAEDGVIPKIFAKRNIINRCVDKLLNCICCRMYTDCILDEGF